MSVGQPVSIYTVRAELTSLSDAGALFGVEASGEAESWVQADEKKVQSRTS